MSGVDNLTRAPVADAKLRALIDSEIRSTRLASARAWGRFVALREYALHELEAYKVAGDLYAIDEEAAPGTDIMLFFVAAKDGRRSKLRLVDVAEVIGPSQHQAAIKDARKHVKD